MPMKLRFKTRPWLLSVATLTAVVTFSPALRADWGSLHANNLSPSQRAEIDHRESERRVHERRHVDIVLGLDLRHLEHRGGGAADVERTHGELRARLADGLRGDDAGGFAQFHPGARGQVAAIAIDAHAALAFAGQHRTDLDLLDVRVVDEPGLDFVDLLVRLSEQFLRLLRIRDVVARKPAHEAVAQLDHLVFAFVDGLDPNAVGRAAIVLANNHVLRHIHQFAGHVTRVGGLEGGVGQTLAGAVGRDEVLEHRKSLTEVGENRFLDDVAGRLGHQSAHAGKLADLLPIAARAGIDHQRDRVIFFLALVVIERLQHDVRNLVGAMCPDVDDLVVAFAWGDNTLAILLLDLLDLLLGGVDFLILFLGNDHVVDADRHARARGLAEAELLELVEHGHRLFVTTNLVTDRKSTRLNSSHLGISYAVF